MLCELLIVWTTALKLFGFSVYWVRFLTNYNKILITGFQLCYILCYIFRQYRMPLHQLVSCVGGKQFRCPKAPLVVRWNSTPWDTGAGVSSWTQDLYQQAVRTVCFWTSGPQLMLTSRLLIWMWWWIFMMEVWWQAVDMNLVSYWAHCVTLTFAERNRLSLSLSGNKLLSAN